GRVASSREWRWACGHGRSWRGFRYSPRKPPGDDLAHKGHLVDRRDLSDALVCALSDGRRNSAVGIDLTYRRCSARDDLAGAPRGTSARSTIRGARYCCSGTSGNDFGNPVAIANHRTAFPDLSRLWITRLSRRSPQPGSGFFCFAYRVGARNGTCDSKGTSLQRRAPPRLLGRNSPST